MTGSVGSTAPRSERCCTPEPPLAVRWPRVSWQSIRSGARPEERNPPRSLKAAGHWRKFGWRPGRPRRSRAPAVRAARPGSPQANRLARVINQRDLPFGSCCSRCDSHFVTLSGCPWSRPLQTMAKALEKRAENLRRGLENEKPPALAGRGSIVRGSSEDDTSSLRSLTDRLHAEAFCAQVSLHGARLRLVPGLS